MDVLNQNTTIPIQVPYSDSFGFTILYPSNAKTCAPKGGSYKDYEKPVFNNR